MWESVEDATQLTVGDLEMGPGRSGLVYYTRYFAHYPPLLDIVLAMVAVVRRVDDGGKSGLGSDLSL